MVLRGGNKGDGPNGNQRIQMILRSNAKQMLSHNGLTIDSITGFPRWTKPGFNLNKNELSWMLKLGWATHATERGVERAHIVTCDDGSILEELFTARRGYGTCISQDDYQAPHPEDWNDDLSKVE